MEAQIWNVAGWVDETDPDKLRSRFERALRESGFGVMNFQEHFFTPQGYSALWLLSESHFALHTFPECEKTYYELSSCVGRLYENFLARLEEGEIGAKKYYSAEGVPA
jgi:S-adenosylmethionine/arginine decarboxylase-like enzyme